MTSYNCSSDWFVTRFGSEAACASVFEVIDGALLDKKSISVNGESSSVLATEIFSVSTDMLSTDTGAPLPNISINVNGEPSSALTAETSPVSSGTDSAAGALLNDLIFLTPELRFEACVGLVAEILLEFCGFSQLRIAGALRVKISFRAGLIVEILLDLEDVQTLPVAGELLFEIFFVL